MFKSFRNKKVLVTGHTGFKGSWLSLWLENIGAKVYGISQPTRHKNDHFNFIESNCNSFIVDIRDTIKFKKTLSEINPDFVFHLAAQPLVRDSYNNPLDTWNTNVIGTANLLEYSRELSNLLGLLVITSDKCYENKEVSRGYIESDSLGGHDPYSASKGACEILTNSFRKSFYSDSNNPLIASARAGNVVGGGDWSEDRLIPDIMRSIQKKDSLIIRSPNSTRPWQHVLDCLYGYLLLGEKLINQDSFYADAWNFGPDKSGNIKVQNVLNKIKDEWSIFDWKIDRNKNPHEASLLFLDNSKSKKYLNWKPIWDIDKTIHETVLWYRNFILDNKISSLSQIKMYEKDIFK